MTIILYYSYWDGLPGIHFRKSYDQALSLYRLSTGRACDSRTLVARCGLVYNTRSSFVGLSVFSFSRSPLGLSVSLIACFLYGA